MSGPFRFLVGPEKTEYMMHAELVASISQPLKVLVTGSMVESCRGVAEWPEVDDATFMRFFQFAYSGNFQDEEPEERPTPAEPPALGEPPAPREYDEPEPQLVEAFIGRPRRNRIQANPFSFVEAPVEKKTTLWESFTEMYPPLESQTSGWPLPDQNPVLDFTRVFLAYARLYVLADEKDIQGLAALSLRRLHHILKHFNLQGHGPDSIASLAEYCFENTCDKGGAQDELRRLVCLFSASKLKILWTSQSFRRAFVEIGDFSIGVVGMLVEGLD
ncbi:BTB/POZ fold protein [Apiospora saccharicola]|uniref:BTB/POZ fold protein n=1 Tax=Apiospora saccharicola TaxID=335842 RepID=A0ABR1VCQ8_9PEZI